MELQNIWSYLRSVSNFEKFGKPFWEKYSDNYALVYITEEGRWQQFGWVYIETLIACHPINQLDKNGNFDKEAPDFKTIGKFSTLEAAQKAILEVNPTPCGYWI